MNLFLYSHQDEPVTGLLLSLASSAGWATCSIGDWIEHVEVDDSFTKETGRRVWRHHGFETTCDDLIIDRVFRIPDEWPSIEEGDKAYLRNELYAYFHYLRNSSDRYRTTLFHESPHDWRVNLLEQWGLVRDLLPSIAVPQYWFRTGRTPQLARDIIVTDPSSFYNWRPNANDPAAKGSLLVRRPEGDPVMVLDSRRKSLTKGMASPEAIAGTRALRERLGLPFLEALFFAEGPKLTFAMMSVQPSARFSSAEVEDVLKEIFEG